MPSMVKASATIIILNSLEKFLQTIYIVFVTFRNFIIWVFDLQSYVLFLVFIFYFLNKIMFQM